MNRAERRRSGEKEREPVYLFTRSPFEQHCEEIVKTRYKDRERELLKVISELREERRRSQNEMCTTISDHAVFLMFALPCEVLKDHFWKKSYAKQLRQFTDRMLEYLIMLQNRELDVDMMRKDLWEYGGVRFEEKERQR